MRKARISCCLMRSPSTDSSLHSRSETIGSSSALVIAVTLISALWTSEATARQSFDRGLSVFAPQPLPGAALAEFTTRFKAEHERRAHNVRQAALRLHGLTLSPYEKLSYNRVIGPRDEHLGYRMAPAIDRGKYVDQSGGGVCQPSSTLHAAAVLGGLEIVERFAHTWIPVYIAPGFDASVSYGVKDLVIRNSHPFEVRVAVEAVADRVTIRLFGAKARAAYTDLRTEVRSQRPFKTVVVADTTMGPGTERLELFGLDGYTVDRAVATMHSTGRTHVRKIRDDVYIPRDAIIMAGEELAPGESAAADIVNDFPTP